MTNEQQRMHSKAMDEWRLWGPYLSERQWGTVREDYSTDGNAWDFITHDMARSKAYRWGEDGIGAVSDTLQRLCLSLALWNEKDPILKERFFGLTGTQGNHGEDVKELYYYLDNLPSHAYMKMLYKVPQGQFPYQQLVETNRSRDKTVPEFELLDTGIFDEDRYFDVFIEYAKEDIEDIVLRIRAVNRGPEAAPIHLIPLLWFRNTWSWGYDRVKPRIRLKKHNVLEADHPTLRRFFLHIKGTPEILFTENETNTPRLYHQDARGPFKDGFHDRIIHDRNDAVYHQHQGTKAGLWYRFMIPAGGEEYITLRLARKRLSHPFESIEKIIDQRVQDANHFYEELQRGLHDIDEQRVQRQALAGLLWSKQFYYLDIPQWLQGDPDGPPPPAQRATIRNTDWEHLNNADIISMPDTWEYPWYAVWDLAFHCIPFAMIDPDFAKQQLFLFTREWYMHPNGQLPAYEWNFGDVNPPVHAWAAWRVYKIEKKQRGHGDLDFLERIFHKLLLNFTWWVNKKDQHGKNIFQGGFLGMDNIGVFDRSKALPTGGHIDQADGTAWMAMFSLNMLRLSLELSRTRPLYQDLATKFFEHFLYIAGAMTHVGPDQIGLWDETDEFFYDVLHLPDGHSQQLRVRSMVGLIPLFAVEVLEPDLMRQVPEFETRLNWFLRYKPELARLVSRWTEPGMGERRLLSLLRGHRMKMLLKRMLDESEFLSQYGIRSLSKVYEQNPYTLHMNGSTYSVGYQPAESDSYMFGGNSNWRGPIWFPVNYLIVESLQRFHHYYGDDFKIEHPTGSDRMMTIQDVANELSRRLTRIFLRDSSGRRPVFGNIEKLQTDPNFRDYVPFYEYFHGDTGRGAGAAHQTGWTALVAKLLQPRQG